MTTHRFETYKRKDEALRVHSPWLRLIESGTAPQGQWYCVHCHNNPTLRHPKDKLATMKTSVSKYSNLKLHENSACHKAVMDAIEQKNTCHMRQSGILTESPTVHRTILISDSENHLG